MPPAHSGQPSRSQPASYMARIAGCTWATTSPRSPWGWPATPATSSSCVPSQARNDEATAFTSEAGSAARTISGNELVDDLSQPYRLVPLQTVPRFLEVHDPGARVAPQQLGLVLVVDHGLGTHAP